MSEMPMVKVCTCGGPMVANASHGEPVSYRCFHCDHHQIVGHTDHLVASPIKGYSRCIECKALIGGLSTHWGWCSHSEQSAAIAVAEQRETEE